jgi:uncharacterized protein YlxW (UPF0749 family)
MQHKTSIVILFLLCVLLGSVVAATAQQSAPERAASLRVQLTGIQTKQDELQARVQELDELLKPENIASALAGVGSVHPEELREQRRRRLANERAGVSAQLDQLNASRTRLETAIAEADAAAYQQSARPDYPETTVKGPKTADGGESPAKSQGTVRHRSRRPKQKKR